MNAPFSAPDRKPATDTFLIDCDIHPIVNPDNIYKRMSKSSMLGIDKYFGPTGSAREYNRCLFPTASALRLDESAPGGGLPGSNARYCADYFLERWDIRLAMLTPLQATNFISWGNDRGAGEYLSALNDCLLEEWHEEDRRFRVNISVSSLYPEHAVGEIKRLADHPGVSGIFMPLTSVSLGRAALDPIYQASAHHKLPILIHPTGVEGHLVNSGTTAGGTMRTYAEFHMILGHAGQSEFAALVLSGALERNRDLRVVFVEHGLSWVAPMMWRMDAAWKAERRGSNPDERLPSQQIVEQLRFTTQPYEEPDRPQDILPFFDAISVDRTLMFSSDYPHWDSDQPDEVFGRIPEAIRQRVANETAIETFGERAWL